MFSTRHDDPLRKFNHERFQIVPFLNEHDNFIDLCNLVSSEHLCDTDDLEEGDDEERCTVRT